MEGGAGVADRETAELHVRVGGVGGLEQHLLLFLLRLLMADGMGEVVVVVVGGVVMGQLVSPGELVELIDLVDVGL
jgi:hypothetical protein